MLTVNDSTKNAYFKDSSRKQLTITFPDANIVYHNDDIDLESLALEESINSGEQLTFEGCIASKFKFRSAASVRDLRGEFVTASITADNTEPIPLFQGYVEAQTNQTHEDIITEFTAYDVLYRLGNIDVTSWYNGLTFPITIKNFRNSLFNLLGITQKSVTLINDNLQISKITTKNQLLALNVIKFICQVNGVFGRIGRTGNFEYVRLREVTQGLYPGENTYPGSETYPSSDGTDIRVTSSNYSKVTYEPFETSPITAIYCINQDGTKVTTGSGTNVFVISDNIVAQGCTNKTLMLTNLFSQISWITYIPNNMKSKGFPWIECGDMYVFSTRINSVRAYLLSRCLTGVQQLFDSFSADGTEQREPYIETEKTQASTQEVSLQEEHLNRIEAESTLRSAIEQNSGSIRLLVEDIGDVQSEIELLPHSITLGVTGTAGKSTGARITLTLRDADGDTIGSPQIGTIYINGDTVFTSDLTDGATIISGDNILTGTILAQYIEANAIAAGSLTVGTKFSASVQSGKVTIGGFEVDSTRIMADEDYVSSSNPGIMIRNGAGPSIKALAIGYTSYRSYDTAKFYVNGNGDMYATNAHITGNINATTGQIGSFEITDIDGYYSALAGGQGSYIKVGDIKTGGLETNELETSYLYDANGVRKEVHWVQAQTAQTNNYYVLCGVAL